MSTTVRAPLPHVAFALCLVLALAAPAGAALFVVDDLTDVEDALPGDGACATAVGTCTLRAAVMESNLLEGRDLIEVPAGVLVLGGAPLEIFDGVEIRGAGMDATIVDADGQSGVVWAMLFGASDRELFVSDLTLRGADAAPAVFAMGCYLHLDRAALRDNAGAAVRMQTFGDVMEIADSIVADNAGIGVDFAADAEGLIRDSVLERNGGAGVSVGSDSGPSLQRSVVRANRDGGVRIRCGSGCGIAVERSLIAANESADGAGGIDARGAEASVFIADSTISGNRGTIGGGIALRDDGNGYVTGAWIEGSTIVRNEATVRGGGLAASAAAGWRDPLFPYPFFSLVNTLVAENAATTGPDCDLDAGASIQSEGHNLIGIACAALAALPSDRVGDAAAPLDPRLASLGANDTHALLPSSPALDAGSPEPLGASATACTTADQRGVSRDGDGDGDGVARCDIGAFELRESCSDLLDNDGDGAVDSADAGCVDPSRKREDPACQNGLDDDGDGAIDFDGGAAANGGVAIAPADAECIGQPARNREGPLPACGFGAEVALALALLRRGTRRSALG